MPKNHRYDALLRSLPGGKGGKGRHKCAGCAYDKGFQDGIALNESIELSLDTLPNSQAGVVRHKSPHAAYALGCLEGVNRYYSL